VPPWIVRYAPTLYAECIEVGQFSDHDRAQDAFYLEKLRHPENIVELSEIDQAIQWVVFMNNRPDAIFSNQGDANAWANQLTERFHFGGIEVVAYQMEPLSWTQPPVNEARTIWERLLSEEDDL
jgi:hypothetical protein